MKIKIGNIPEWIKDEICNEITDCTKCPFVQIKENGLCNCRKRDYDAYEDEVEIADEFFKEG